MQAPSPIRVAVVITGLATGGAELMLVRLLERLDRRRFEPYVISLMDAGDLGRRISALGIGLFELRMPRGRPTAKALFALIAFFRRWRPSIIHSWMYHADLLASLGGKVAGRTPIIWCIRSSAPHRLHISWLTHLTVRACALLSHFVPARIVSCSHTAARIHVDAGYRADKFRVIPNGFDLDRFHPDRAARDAVRAELNLSDDTLLVGLIGRFDPQKNHFGFLTAASKLLAVFPTVQFLLVGRDVQRTNPELARAIDNAGLSSAIHLLGQRTDVSRLMAAIDLLVSSSSYGEAFPNVVAEAMACGVPCVVTDVGDAALLVGDTGHVVAPGDMDGLAAAMRAVLSMPRQDRTELGRAARERVRERFEIRNVVEQYQSLYEQLHVDARIGS